MAVPVSQMWTVASYVLGQRLKGKKQYPLVLMLEPLFRCNLNCAGCGKTQYPTHVLKRQLTLEECIEAVEECGAPIVSIPGGEPLLHPEMPKIVEALVARKKYIYLCTNALLLKLRLDEYKPSKFLSFSVHLDGLEEQHDDSVCVKGAFQKALAGIKEAVARGFRVTTNSTYFEGSDPEKARDFFDAVMALGVEGMMISPGYSYNSAPRQDHFLQRKRSTNFFRKLLHKPHRGWVFNQSPLFLEFLAGTRHFECTPWGNPTYNIFGWQLPCYLLQEGYAQSYAELMEKTKWEDYGHQSGNPKCSHCMVHSGHEPTAVDATFNSWQGFWATVRATVWGPQILSPFTDSIPMVVRSEEAAKPSDEPSSVATTSATAHGHQC